MTLPMINLANLDSSAFKEGKFIHTLIDRAYSWFLFDRSPIQH